MCAATCAAASGQTSGKLPPVEPLAKVGEPVPPLPPPVAGTLPVAAVRPGSYAGSLPASPVPAPESATAGGPVSEGTGGPTQSPSG